MFIIYYLIQNPQENIEDYILYHIIFILKKKFSNNS